MIHSFFTFCFGDSASVYLVGSGGSQYIMCVQVGWGMAHKWMVVNVFLAIPAKTCKMYGIRVIPR